MVSDQLLRLEAGLFDCVDCETVSSTKMPSRRRSRSTGAAEAAAEEAADAAAEAVASIEFVEKVFDVLEVVGAKRSTRSRSCRSS